MFLLVATLAGCGSFYREVSFRGLDAGVWHAAAVNEYDDTERYVFECGAKQISVLPVRWERIFELHHILIIPWPSFDKEGDRSGEVLNLEDLFHKKYDSPNLFMLVVNYNNAFSEEEIGKPIIELIENSFHPIDKKIYSVEKQGISLWYLFDVDLSKTNRFRLILKMPNIENCGPPPLTFIKVEEEKWMAQGLAA